MEKKILPFNWREELKDIRYDSIDDDFFLLEKPVITSTFDYPFKIDVTTAIVCLKGEMSGWTNLKYYKTQAPCMFVVLPNQILQYERFSEDFEGLFIVMSKSFTENLLLSIQERVPLFFSFQNDPWIPLGEEEIEAMMMYFQMMKRATSVKENPNRLEMAKHLTKAFFYGIGYYIHRIPEGDKKTKQELLVEKFLDLVQKNYKKERMTEFYADRLCLTPKYLSKVIKENTGKSASEWIDDYVILEAKALLKSTNMTIQQISDDLNFPSQSFFGKYFKRQTGVSPKFYRNE